MILDMCATSSASNRCPERHTVGGYPLEQVATVDTAASAITDSIGEFTQVAVLFLFCVGIDETGTQAMQRIRHGIA